MSIPMKHGLVGLLVCSLLVVSSIGRAQERFNLQTFRPTPAQRVGIVNVHGARLLAPLDFDLHLMGSLGWSPFEIETPEGLTEGKVVSSIVAGDLLFAIGLHERIEVGLDLPLMRMQQGDGIPGFREPLLQETHIGLGDIRLVPRILCYSTFEGIEDESGWALTLVADASIPSGDQEAYAGDGGLRLDPKLAFEVGFTGGHMLAVNAGYTVRPSTRIETLEVDDAFTFGVGGDVRLHSIVHLVGEADMALTFADDLGSEEIPLELLVGGRFFLGPVMAQVGLGSGVSGGVGAPDFRAYVSVGWAHVRDLDDDDDGIEDEVDGCPDDAEDFDGFEDADGCPDLDNDDDGIADVDDGCPDAVEDFNGFEDADGCPEGDDDADGVLNPVDECPNAPEDPDGFEDSDGCPDLDNDGDGLPDEADGCPDVAGPDNGCPVAAPPIVETVVRFETGSSELDEQDTAALDALVASFGQAPAGTTVEIAGHTDNTGTEERNTELSRRRAEAVRDYLVQMGIGADRITLEGYGPSRPLAPNDTEEGRAANRRAEIRLVLPR